MTNPRLLFTTAFRSIGAIFVGLSIACVSAQALSEGTNSTSEAKAREIARTEFKKYTNSRVRKFSLKLFEETNKRWVFSAKGEGEFNLPGSLWFVEVDKKTGNANVTHGD